MSAKEFVGLRPGLLAWTLGRNKHEGEDPEGKLHLGKGGGDIDGLAGGLLSFIALVLHCLLPREEKETGLDGLGKETLLLRPGFPMNRTFCLSLGHR